MKKLVDFSIKWKLTFIILITSGVSLLMAMSVFVVYDVLKAKKQVVAQAGIFADVVGNNCVDELLRGGP